ncbi:hypothetical protein [Streptomyces sp. NBRC 110028]|uniref:hypothetical protein n=1 Tax=Streptomyces sp. NBRC 110028 TaxID=1621260 RepID=UPI0006E3B492|nr:hypothetical protein [Streptomyces sp. NBRC 110028]
MSAAVGLAAVLTGGGIVALKATGSPAPGDSAPAASVASHTGPLTSKETREASRIAVGAATGQRPTHRGGQKNTQDENTHDENTKGGSAKGTEGGEKNAAGGSGAEVLDTRRPPRAKSTAAPAPDSEAEVQLYDYASDSLITRLVDLRSGKVVRSTRQHGVQPPPTLAEVRQAVKVILADRRLGDGMRASYRAETKKRLTSPSQLRVQGMSFLGTRAKGVKGAEQVSRCGTHRCVQLFVRVPGGKWIDTSRIVIDLSAGRTAVIGL